VRFDWRGLVALVLALGVLGVLLVGAIAAALNHDRQLTSEDLATVSTVLGAAIGAVAVYLGGRPRSEPPRSLSPSGGRTHPGGQMSETRRERRRIRRGDTYTADEDADLEAPQPDANPPAEADQVGDLEHEGGPDDGGN
jgi:hypothetical protein